MISWRERSLNDEVGETCKPASGLPAVIWFKLCCHDHFIVDLGMLHGFKVLFISRRP